MLAMSSVRGKYEVVKANPNRPRGIKNVAVVRQDPKDSGKLGTKKPTGNKVSNIVGRSAKTGQLRSRPTNLSKYPRPRPTIPTPAGAVLALAPIAYEQTKEQQKAGSDSMGKTIATRMKDTARDIQGTPAEIAADKKRAVAKKKKEEAAKKKEAAAKKKRLAMLKRLGVIDQDVTKASAKNKMSNEAKNAEVYVDSAVTYDMENIPKAYGGKVVSRKKGGKVGRGCGAAIRGGGAVRKS